VAIEGGRGDDRELPFTAILLRLPVFCGGSLRGMTWTGGGDLEKHRADRRGWPGGRAASGGRWNTGGAPKFRARAAGKSVRPEGVKIETGK